MRALCLGLPAPAWPGTDKRRQIRKGLFEQTGGEPGGVAGSVRFAVPMPFPTGPQKGCGSGGKDVRNVQWGDASTPRAIYPKETTCQQCCASTARTQNVGSCGECVRASQRDSSADAVKGPNAYRSILYQSDGASEAESGLVIRCFLRESDRKIHQRESFLPSARVGGPVGTRRTAGLVTGRAGGVGSRLGLQVLVQDACGRFPRVLLEGI